MKTSREISTISYNTSDFLKAKLDDLKKKGFIGFYAFIKHHAEEDEKKEHIHLYLIPEQPIDTLCLTKLFEEADTDVTKPPLGVKKWNRSKWEDWYLYAIHDKAYLMKKGQTRKHYYSKDDIETDDRDYLLELIHMIDYAKYKGLQTFLERIKNGASLPDLICEGVIPPQQFIAYREMYNIITQQVRHDTPYRNGRDTHTPNVNPETGEIIEDTNGV